MSEYVNPVDRPDLGLLPTFAGLLRLWRAQWRLGLLGLSLALLYTAISILIPLTTQRAVDDAIVTHKHPLWPYIVVIVGLAAIRFAGNFTRRFATARIGIRIEAKMRELLYTAYLRYPRAFYDRHATGQVLSRATNDLYPIRYFIEAADEAVVGIEMVQAFGREDDVRGRFGTKAEAVRDTVLKQAGVEARHLPGLYYLPALSIAAVVFFGGRAVIGGDLTIGQFVLFETLLLQLVWPLEALGWITNLGHPALASAGRSFAWLEGIQPLPESNEPKHLPAGPLRVRFESVQFAYGGASGVLRDLVLS